MKQGNSDEGAKGAEIKSWVTCSKPQYAYQPQALTWDLRAVKAVEMLTPLALSKLEASKRRDLASLIEAYETMGLRLEQKMHLIALVKRALNAQVAELEKFEQERI